MPKPTTTAPVALAAAPIVRFSLLLPQTWSPTFFAPSTTESDAIEVLSAPPCATKKSDEFAPRLNTPPPVPP